MKKGRISREEEKFIKKNISKSATFLAKELDRHVDSVVDFIKKKVAKGDLAAPPWLNSNDKGTAEFDLLSRPYWKELEQQFTQEELEMFKYHWVKIISQFRDDVIPTEELQVVDLIKLDILMNRSLTANAENTNEINALQDLARSIRQQDPDQIDRDELGMIERQLASLRSSQESLNRDYRDLQARKSQMLKDMKATREQRVKRLEESRENFSSWIANLASNPEVARKYGEDMEKMRLAIYKERDRLSDYHKYSDGSVDQPFLTPDTVLD